MWGAFTRYRVVVLGCRIFLPLGWFSLGASLSSPRRLWALVNRADTRFSLKTAGNIYIKGIMLELIKQILFWFLTFKYVKWQHLLTELHSPFPYPLTDKYLVNSSMGRRLLQLGIWYFNRQWVLNCSFFWCMASSMFPDFVSFKVSKYKGRS